MKRSHATNSGRRDTLERYAHEVYRRIMLDVESGYFNLEHRQVDAVRGRDAQGEKFGLRFVVYFPNDEIATYLINPKPHIVKFLKEYEATADSCSHAHDAMRMMLNLMLARELYIAPERAVDETVKERAKFTKAFLSLKQNSPSSRTKQRGLTAHVFGAALMKLYDQKMTSLDKLGVENVAAVMGKSKESVARFIYRTFPGMTPKEVIQVHFNMYRENENRDIKE